MALNCYVLHDSSTHACDGMKLIKNNECIVCIANAKLSPHEFRATSSTHAAMVSSENV